MNLFKHNCLASIFGISSLAIAAITSVNAAQLVVVKAAHQVLPTMIGANSVTRQHLPHHEPWFDTLSMDTLQRTNFSVLRYPGGTLGNKFDWTTGTQRGNNPENRNYLAEHTKIATDATDGKVVWMLNVFDESLNETIAALNIAERQGVEIKYVELGNEFYFSSLSGLDYEGRWATGTDYASEMNTWIETLRSEFPDMLFAVPLSHSPNKDPLTRKSKWNADVIAGLTTYDAYTVHFYVSPSPKNENKIPTYAGFSYDTLVTAEQQVQRNYFTENGDAIKTFLGLPLHHWATTLEHENLWFPADKPVWFTEFGMKEVPYVIHGTWADGLADFVLYSTLLSEDNAEMATEQQFIDLAHDDSANLNEVSADVGQNLTTTALHLTAEGHVLKALSKMARDNEIIAPLSFPGANIITPATISSYSSLIGLNFSNSHSSNAIIANLSDQIQSIDTAALGATGADVTVIKAQNFYTFVTSDADVTYITSTMTETLDIPAYSIVTIENLSNSLDPQDDSMQYTPKFTGTHVDEIISNSFTHALDLKRHVSDQNSGDTLTYTLTGNNPNWVSINGNNQLLFDATIETIGATGKVYVRVADSIGLSDYVTLDFKVIDGSLDNDSDGLTNDEEFILGTYALVNDSDGDGVNDGQDFYPLDPTRSGNGDINNPPTVDAGNDMTIDEGTTVSLSATASDVEGDTLSYSWTQSGGPSVNIQGSNSLTPSFIAPQVSSNQTVVLTLTVSDGAIAVEDLVSVTVNNVQTNTENTDSNSSQGGGSLSWVLMLCLMLIYSYKVTIYRS